MRQFKRLGVAAAIVALCGTAQVSFADTYDTDDSDHPMRIVGHAAHAYGKAWEFLVTRPVHWAVSRPKLRYVFGHTSHPRTEDYCGDPDLYQRYSY